MYNDSVILAAVYLRLWRILNIDGFTSEADWMLRFGL
jgi:hypothetical protein